MSSAQPSFRANYITNLALSETSGGWSGFNVAIFNSLARHFSLTYVGPISPREDLQAKIHSKLRRSIGKRGSFSFFSPRRLEAIARITEQRVDSGARLDFFHGSTPWVRFRPPVPYACYLDVCFATYVAVYHDRSQFEKVDLERISDLEAAWLGSAARVFFSSKWGLENAVSAYGLERTRLRVAGLGGHLPIPTADKHAGGLDFLFIALDFEGKGGQICVDAFEQLRRRFPHARLRIVGEQPPANVMAKAGVAYEGFLRKSVPAELGRLQEIMSSAFALVHPTVRDATPQVIVEAQYHGCPAIAPRSFGIPEMIVDGVTGCLVDAPPTVDEVADRMLWLCLNPAAYGNLRRAARARALDQFTWEQVGERMAAELRSVVA